MVKENNIKRLIIAVPIIGVILTSVILTNFFIKEMKTQYEIERSQLIIDEEKAIKSLVKNRVENTIKLLTKDYQDAIEKEKEEVKNTIDIAYKIIEDVYYEFNYLSNEKILEKIKARLKPLRFYENLSGYYFVFKKDGTNVFHPYVSSIEGKNFKNIENHNAKNIIKTFLDTLDGKDEGFVKWDWYKPNEFEMKTKVGYIKVFEPLKIFVGSAKYEEDLISNTKKHVQSLLNIITFENDAYIFAYNQAGTTISHAKKTLLGKNRWMLNTGGRYMVQEIVQKAKREDGAFIRYLATYNPKTKRPAEKISYVKNFDIFNWALGSGEYTYSIVESIKKKEKQLKEKQDRVVYQVVLLSFLFTFISSIIMLIISNKVTSIFSKYRKHLEKVNDTLELKVKYRTKELEESKEKLKRMALHDPLTDLYNRRYFDTIIEELISLSIRNKEPLCLILLDIDHFKKINDSYGHDVGDMVLKKLAKELLAVLRDSDVITRIGGEEFAIVFPKTKISGAYKTSEKIREIIENLKIKIDEETTISFTISIGVAVFDESIDKNTHTMIKRADKALYKAKNSGRNKVVVYDENEGEK